MRKCQITVSVRLHFCHINLSIPLMRVVCLFLFYAVASDCNVHTGSIIADCLKNHFAIFLLDISSQGPSLTTFEIAPQQLITSMS